MDQRGSASPTEASLEEHRPSAFGNLAKLEDAFSNLTPSASQLNANSFHQDQLQPCAGLPDCSACSRDISSSLHKPGWASQPCQHDPADPGQNSSDAASARAPHMARDSAACDQGGEGNLPAAQSSSSSWKQAWDHNWSCWYYYNEALQVRHAERAIGSS